MKIAVLVEPMKDNGYRVSGLGPDAVVAEGKTDAEAMANFRKAIEARIRAGARLTYLEVTTDEAVTSRDGKLNPDDPLVREWKDIMAENRRRDDDSPDVL